MKKTKQSRPRKTLSQNPHKSILAPQFCTFSSSINLYRKKVQKSMSVWMKQCLLTICLDNMFQKSNCRKELIAQLLNVSSTAVGKVLAIQNCQKTASPRPQGRGFFRGKTAKRDNTRSVQQGRGKPYPKGRGKSAKSKPNDKGKGKGKYNGKPKSHGEQYKPKPDNPGKNKAAGKFKATGKGKPKPNGEQYKPKPNATGKNKAAGKSKATGKGKQQP